MGESVGVFAEPELLKKRMPPHWARTRGWQTPGKSRSATHTFGPRLGQKLVASDKFIIVASDGVWEFMTTQMVVDMTHELTSPLKACKAVVQEGYKL